MSLRIAPASLSSESNCLVVHDDGKQVVAVGEVVAFRLVDEDAGFSHCFPG